MAKVLIVEDSNFFSTVLKRGIEMKLGFEAVCATSYAETEALLTNLDDDIYVAFVDLNLGDFIVHVRQMLGQVIEFLIKRRIQR